MKACKEGKTNRRVKNRFHNLDNILNKLQSKEKEDFSKTRQYELDGGHDKIIMSGAHQQDENQEEV